MVDHNDKLFLRNIANVKRIFGDKWTIPVMVALSGGPMRRAEILATVDLYAVDAGWSGKATGLHDSILTRTLKKMLAAGLVRREEIPGSFPRHVRYALQPEALDFLERVRRLGGWSEQNAHVVVNAQEFYRHHAGLSDDACPGSAGELRASG